MLNTTNHWRGTNPLGKSHELMIERANEALLKRLNGENPANDSTRRSRKLAKALDVFREDIEQVVLSYESGRMSVSSALELIVDYDAAITAIIRCE